MMSDQKQHETEAVTFHGKLNVKYAPILLPLALAIFLYNCVALVIMRKCYKFLSDQKNGCKNSLSTIKILNNYNDLENGVKMTSPKSNSICLSKQTQTNFSDDFGERDLLIVGM